MCGLVSHIQKPLLGLFRVFLCRNESHNPSKLNGKFNKRLPLSYCKVVINNNIEKPSVIRRILKHLDLWEDPMPPPQSLELVWEPCADYVPWRDDVPGTISFRLSWFSEIEVG